MVHSSFFTLHCILATVYAHFISFFLYSSHRFRRQLDISFRHRWVPTALIFLHFAALCLHLIRIPASAVILMENLPSTSSFSESFSSVYDVFINHRGPDVKFALAQPLYCRLRDDLNIQVFLDREELQMGDIIPSSIPHAIKKASVHIAIFSKRYAESPWCLDELCLMLGSGSVILPVFYDVKPSDLRWIEKGVYADAFKAHERKQRYDSQIIQKWKETLKKVSYRTGLEFDSRSNQDHEDLLQIIVNNVSQHVKMDLEVAAHPVGLDEEIEKFETKMAEYEQQGENVVKVVGIVGMGGSGKTTLAKELYNRKKSEYRNKSCFLFDVRESSASKGLEYLQGMLLKELGLSSDTIYSSSRGKEVLRRQLRGKRVFIILDDIDHADQLEALLVKDVLRYDSLVLITSRYKDVLTQCGISMFYEKKGMNSKDAIELFCWHAFLQRHPIKGFEDLVEWFLESCRGLPLSLKVIGRQLRGKLEKTYWEGELVKIRKVLHSDIKKVLKISYDALDEEQKEIFLDVACFFVGEKKSKAISIWEASKWNGLHALQVLEDRCLMEFYKEHYESATYIGMHDHLRDMGRDIAKSTRHSIHNSGDEGNYLELIKQPSEDALSKEVGSRILFTLHRRDHPIETLQLLVVDGNRTTRKLVTLLWLRMADCPSTNLPSFLSIENLRVLDIRRSPILKELWDERTTQAPLHLRELYIMETSIPLEKISKCIASLVNLIKLVLMPVHSRSGVSSVRELPDELCCLWSLKCLALCGYRELKSLPARFGDLTGLQYLHLGGCSGLRMLPDSFSQLTQLQYISLYNCPSLIVPQDMFRNIWNLKHANFGYCHNLKTLPIAITRQRYLTTLCVSCPQLPDEIGELRNLEVLEVWRADLTKMPSSLGNLRCLKALMLYQVRNLISLPESVGQLKRLESLVMDDCGVEDLPEGVARLNNLQEMRISRSPVRRLTLRKSESSDENCMSRLKHIELSFTETTFIFLSGDVCPNILTLHIYGCDELKAVELALLGALESLKIRDCKVLKAVRGLSDLAKLRTLDITGCRELEKIEGAGNLSSLKVFKADQCWNLQNIEGLDRLQRLNPREISSDEEIEISSGKGTDISRIGGNHIHSQQ